MMFYIYNIFMYIVVRLAYFLLKCSRPLARVVRRGMALLFLYGIMCIVDTHRGGY